MAKWLAKISASKRDKRLVEQHFTTKALAVEEVSQETFVVSPRFQSCKDVQEVRAAAAELIANVNLAIQLVERHFEGLLFEDTVAEQRNGNLHRTVFAEAHSYGIGTATADAVALGPNGKPLPSPALSRSFAERMLALLGRDDRVREVAFVLRAEPISYQNLFIVYETVKGLVSANADRSDWQTLVNLGWISGDDSKRLWETLGYYHHGHPRGSLTDGPVLALDEAAEMVGDLFRRMVDHLQPT